MNSCVLTSKGQVTIPSHIRHKLGLHSGDKIGFAIEDDRVVLFRKKNKIEEAFGIYRAKRSVSLTDMDRTTRK